MNMETYFSVFFNKDVTGSTELNELLKPLWMKYLLPTYDTARCLKKNLILKIIVVIITKNSIKVNNLIL